jgi:hypothetical protein
MRLAQNDSTSWPIEVTTPRPVITTRREEAGVSINQRRKPVIDAKSKKRSAGDLRAERQENLAKGTQAAPALALM